MQVIFIAWETIAHTIRRRWTYFGVGAIVAHFFDRPFVEPYAVSCVGDLCLFQFGQRLQSNPDLAIRHG